MDKNVTFKIATYRIRSNVNYDGRITKGKVYKGTVVNDSRTLIFRDDYFTETGISFRSCKDGSWFKILPNNLNEKTKIL